VKMAAENRPTFYSYISDRVFRVRLKKSEFRISIRSIFFFLKR
jgi:hypothetical protein